MTTASIPVASGDVLVASADSRLRAELLARFHTRHAAVQMASGGAEAFAKLDKGNWRMLVLDRQLPDLNAEELVELTRRLYPGIQVLVVDSSPGDSMGTGSTAAPGAAKHALSSRGFEPATQRGDEALPGMIGESEPMRRVYRMVRLVARRNTTVLITGPSGSGKEVVARAVHSLSERSGGNFSVLNCAAIPESLIESELFGYARGAFTGAAQPYAGRILSAQGGTLFLDEIGELPLNAQSKLLRFLEQKEIQRLGSADTCKVDVRILAATNRNLAELVGRGNFRDDLFFRLCAFPITLCPLAARRADIAALAAHFVERLATRPPLRLDLRAQQMLEAYAWPGNVRELQQVLERAAILAEDGRVILPEHLVFSFEQTPSVTEKIAC